MKRIILPLLSFLLWSFSCLKAQTVEIFTNPNTSQFIVTGNGGYHVGEMIYENTEIGNANFTSAYSPINRIQVNVGAVGASGTFGNFNVYFKEIPASTNTLSNTTYDKTGYTQVYSGSLNITATGWYVINLQTAFIRTPGMSLQVMFERLDGVSHITSMFTYGATLGNASSGSAASSRRYNGNAAPVIGATTLTASAFRPAIRLEYAGSSVVYYRSRQTGSWNAADTWETSTAADFSMGILSPAAASPNLLNANSVTVATGHTVTITENVSAHPLNVNAGGALVVNGGVVFNLIP